MSLNCLSCQDLQRSDSERECLQGKPHQNKLGCIMMERSWSGNLSPPSHGQMGKKSTAVAARGRLRSNGCEEPRLVRSSGMRRDWSFENLRKPCKINY
ncbi:hypothetical protein NC653_004826 [Populus alba x Populus x berolinensis]|uniref:Uncharacterized protein n=1 Tax=Populus alba x Populus x berolinensis TaxID=444605 RepID=A0AAD6RYD0_9ROSI|nr:hypothetical protein NC653_004826 [Populus alba x Populus x berolinensis]